jgi:hypothetical protein
MQVEQDARALQDMQLAAACVLQDKQCQAGRLRTVPGCILLTMFSLRTPELQHSVASMFYMSGWENWEEHSKRLFEAQRFSKALERGRSLAAHTSFTCGGSAKELSIHRSLRLYG